VRAGVPRLLVVSWESEEERRPSGTLAAAWLRVCVRVCV